MQRLIDSPTEILGVPQSTLRAWAEEGKVPIHRNPAIGYDPCCGTAGMFVGSEKFVEEHGGRIGDIAVYEIPFNRHFYVFKPPRELAEIDAELKIVTDRILTMIGGLRK